MSRHDNTIAITWFNKERDFILTQFITPPSAIEFMGVLNDQIEDIKATLTSHTITDVSASKVAIQEYIHWLTSSFLPAMQDSKLCKSAVILSEQHIEELSLMDSMMGGTYAKIEIKYFQTFSEAEEWIKGYGLNGN